MPTFPMDFGDMRNKGPIRLSHTTQWHFTIDIPWDLWYNGTCKQ